MIWFSSDWHINHQNIAAKHLSKWTSGWRNFDSLEQMNDTIIGNINRYVKEDDTIYFLGDFCFGGHKNTPIWRDKIKCKTIHVCRGNHDLHIDRYKDSFISIKDIQTLKYHPYEFFMSHYSHRIWPASHQGVIHLYGHSHNSILDYGKSMDVGIDVAYHLFGEYRPFSIEEVIEIMNKKEIVFNDSHGPNTNR